MSYVKRWWDKYTEYGKSFIDPALQINDIDKFELFIVYKELLLAVRAEMKGDEKWDKQIDEEHLRSEKTKQL